ncbi:amidase [Frankia sp. AgB32]|uniref:amidase n=1 Tax=Frankia sp. AgB32 TaxID=631119 RepID=UPI00200DA62D|nr:amidase [Frankia sp. AgB32]MCK9895087.1 amidase [Frankia sp. AgB32]
MTLTHHSAGVLELGGIAGITARYRSGDLTPVDLLEMSLRQVEQLGVRSNAIVHLRSDDAGAEARASAERYRNGQPLSALDGIVVTVKDALEVAGAPFTSGSLFFRDRVGVSDARAVARLRAAGAIVLGKTNCAELTLGLTSDNPLFGAVANPDDPHLDAGGSSSGDAVAVRLGCASLGIASDLAGSLRLPAAWSGCFSLKPTPGLVPAQGHSPDAWHEVAVLGALASSVDDLRYFLGVMSAHDPLNPYSVPVGPTSAGSTGFAIVCDQIGPVPLDPGVAAALSQVSAIVSSLGFTILDEGAEFLDQSEDFFWALAGGYGGDPNDLGLFMAHPELIGPTLQNFLELAASSPVDLADFARAAIKRHNLRTDAAELFGRADVILLPASPVTAQPSGVQTVQYDGGEAHLLAAQRCTWMVSMLGLPAVTIPVRLQSGLHAGIQIVGPAWSEERLLDLADRIVRAEVGPTGSTLTCPR